jgi:NADH-quinone oxidoreductase subunit C
LTTLTADALRQLLASTMPDALEAPRPAPAAPEPAPESAPPARRGKAPEAKPDMLATGDVVVLPARVADVARYLRDELGYRYLSNITAVDYLADGLIELVYHFYRLEGGGPLAVKARLPRENPALPSITPFWPGANLQEREAFDLFGVQFVGHPDLRRVYMWDEFEGFPMRKDFPRQGDKYLGDDE